MKPKASVIAQKLLNLYRQAHVIVGGWQAVNRVLVDEATPDVIAELQDLPTGKMLIAHIKNLRSGETRMDTIARELLPYGGMMDETAISVAVANDDLDELINAIHTFVATEDGLRVFMSTPVIKQFGPEWILAAKNALADHPDELDKLDEIVRTWTAYNMWSAANEIINNPLTDRIRAQLQVDMPEYETYLPMFGDAGNQLLRRMHTVLSSMPNDANRTRTQPRPQDD